MTRPPEPSSMALLQVSALSCERDDRLLFPAFDWQAGKGELWQIAGANGAGKTSLLRILAGLLGGWQGRVNWRLGAGDRREQLGYIGHQTGLREELTAEENLAWLVALHDECTNMSRDVCTKKMQKILKQLGLGGCTDVPLAQLSAGQKRRVSLARLWLSPKLVWLLDEPFTAIDQQGVKLLEQRFLELADAGCLVIYTSHHQVSDRARRVQLARQRVEVIA